MQIHELRPKHKKKNKKRVGRGGKRGTYSGRGIKGQKARAGASFQPAIRTFVKRYHKLRGYRFRGTRLKAQILNVASLEKRFKEEDKINPQILLERKLIRRIKGKTPQVKILGKGEITKKLTIENCEVSKTAREKIEKAGGTIVQTHV